MKSSERLDRTFQRVEALRSQFDATICSRPADRVRRRSLELDDLVSADAAGMER